MYTEIELWPKQRDALTIINSCIAEPKPFIALIGQRTGKTLLMGHLVESNPNLSFDFVSVSEKQARINLPFESQKNITYYGELSFLKKYSKYSMARDIDSDVVIVDEAEWLNSANSIAELVTKRNKCTIMITSKGPNKLLTKFAGIEAVIVKGATWDWNPMITPDWCFEDRDFDGAARDFGLYEAHDPNMIKYLYNKYGHNTGSSL